MVKINEHIYFLDVCWCGEITYGEPKYCKGHNPTSKNSRKLRDGDRFGKLIIIGYDCSKNRYICRCDCGYITTSTTYSLKHGHKCCKYCYYKTFSNPRLPNNLGIKNRIYKDYKNSAKSRNIDFKLSKDDFFELILNNCNYCGVQPQARAYSKLRNRYILYNGIDRVDSSKGYTKDNVVACCWICNNSKASLSVTEWKQWIIDLYNKTILNM